MASLRARRSLREPVARKPSSKVMPSKVMGIRGGRGVTQRAQSTQRETVVVVVVARCGVAERVVVPASRIASSLRPPLDIPLDSEIWPLASIIAHR